MELNQINFLPTLNFLASSLRNNLPYVTGNMKMNTRAIMGVNGNTILGSIEINVPYANYVNTGYEWHPNSSKLKRDYKIVERTIYNALRAQFQAYGAIIRKEF